MSRERQETINRQIAEQAAEWLNTLENAGPEEQAAFADWVAESPRHLKEFLFMSALDGELTKLDPDRRVEIEKVLAASNVLALNRHPGESRDPVKEALTLNPASRRGDGKRRSWAAGIAASIIAAAALWWVSSGSTPTYTTAIGEQRTVPLPDGSVLQLNSKSRLQASVTDTARDIRLLEGEAMFKVALDPVRPFRVYAGDTTIQAIGTQFNVNRRPSGVTVSVIEGRVRVSGEVPATLAAGQEIHVSHTGRIERRSAIDPLNISAWRQHRLVFRDDTLEDIVAEFNRYNTRSQIRIEGHGILARRYTAVFDADDPASLLAFLRQDPDLKIESDASVLTVRER